MKYIDII